VAIRIEVMENGKIELFDSQSISWSEHESIHKALAVAAKILHREIRLLSENRFSEQIRVSKQIKSK
jgi:hypothetical protein